MIQPVGTGLRWAAGLGFGLGLMVAGAISSLWLPQPLTDDELLAEAQRRGLTEAPAAAEPGAGGCDRQPSFTFAFTVAPGMTFEEIADLLQEAGAIDDSESFLVRAGEMDAMHRAQPGLYVLTRDGGQPLGNDEIIQRLIEGPVG